MTNEKVDRSRFAVLCIRQLIDDEPVAFFTDNRFRSDPDDPNDVFGASADSADRRTRNDACGRLKLIQSPGLTPTEYPCLDGDR